MPYTGIKIKSKYTDPVQSIDQEGVKGLMEVQIYKLGEVVYEYHEQSGYYFPVDNPIVKHSLSESELLRRGATPLIESEGMLEENIVAIRMSLTTSGAGLGEVSCELLAEQLVKINKAINALQKGVK